MDGDLVLLDAPRRIPTLFDDLSTVNQCVVEAACYLTRTCNFVTERDMFLFLQRSGKHVECLSGLRWEMFFSVLNDAVKDKLIGVDKFGNIFCTSSALSVVHSTRQRVQQAISTFSKFPKNRERLKELLKRRKIERIPEGETQRLWNDICCPQFSTVENGNYSEERMCSVVWNDIVFRHKNCSPPLSKRSRSCTSLPGGGFKRRCTSVDKQGDEEIEPVIFRSPKDRVAAPRDRSDGQRSRRKIFWRFPSQ